MATTESSGLFPRLTSQLAAIAAAPLEYCPDFPRIAQRHEQWWRGKLEGGPLLLPATNTNPARPLTRRLELLHDPDRWFSEKLLDLRQLHFGGDSLPYINVDFGMALMAAAFGAKVEFRDDIAWIQAFIHDDWANAPQWRLDRDNGWLALARTLLAKVTEHAAGKYLVCPPDLGGSADLLASLRGSANLCMDVIDAPERLGNAIDALYPIWREIYLDQYHHAAQRGAGVCHWLGLWSNQPYVIPACDFSFVIGPKEFESICLPDIARQASDVGRAIFHLDGPGSARHIDALLKLPQLQAIQFTPGDATTSALAWVDLFRKIQNHGKCVLVSAPPKEVAELCQQVDPSRLAVSFSPPDLRAKQHVLAKVRRLT